MSGVEHLHDSTGRLLAIVIRERAAFGSACGVRFFTPPDLCLQVGSMRHPAGRRIAPHVHASVTRQVEGVSEVLLVRKGHLRAFLYGDGYQYQTTVLGPGDIVVLVAGGHGFEALEEVEVFEVKTGPYLGTEDKRLLEVERGSVSAPGA